MSQATEIYSREFDAIFFRLPPQVQGRILARIRELGSIGIVAQRDNLLRRIDFWKSLSHWTFCLVRGLLNQRGTSRPGGTGVGSPVALALD